MERQIQYEVHEKENIYFAFKIIAALIGYFSIIYFVSLVVSRQPAAMIPLVVYSSIFIFYLLFKLGVMVGYIKGNSVKVSSSQFPEIHKILVEQCQLLELDSMPDLYIMQNGGLLNAFAATFFGSNYIVIYSDILEEAYENNIEAVKFVIGHELGHIKRKHLTKSVLLFPSAFIPFLNSAYSRGCEYTCDNIGAALSPKGAKPGLILLASGKRLWKKVNVEKFTDQEITEDGFWFWFAEKVSTHPRLTKRVLRFKNLKTVKEVFVPPVVIEAEPAVRKESDHANYMPK